MSRPADRAQELITRLGLIRHPEGGYYGEVYRSSTLVQPRDGRTSRPALTTIYFLLPGGAISRWHRVLSDEVWHHYEGSPLDLWIASEDGTGVQRHRLGPWSLSESPVHTVPGGCWQAARSPGSFTLVGCTVAPGFEFQDFSLAAEHPAVVRALTAAGSEYAELL